MNLRKFALLALSTLLVSVACSNSGEPAAILPTATIVVVQPTEPPPPPVVPTNTPVPPTPTPTAPMAAMVNDVPIFLADFEAELARFAAAQAGIGITPTEESEAANQEQVLNSLIERQLILEAAAADGIIVAPETVDQRLADLRAAGDEASFQAFLQTNKWTEEEFRQILEAELITGEMVARVTADVPTAVEQVRASYIQMDDGAAAQQVLVRAQAGDDFAFLAQQNSVDRLTGANGGDLGFFAPGSLLVPEVEEAAFALQPGEISDLITVSGADGKTTYYIIMVTERDPSRELTADARYNLMQTAFQAWLDSLWANATIERFIP